MGIHLLRRPSKMNDFASAIWICTCIFLIEIIEIIEIWFIFAAPIQIPSKSLANPISRLFLGTDLQRFYNGIRTEVEGRRISSTFPPQKNFFALILHSYIVTFATCIALERYTFFKYTRTLH